MEDHSRRDVFRIAAGAVAAVPAMAQANRSPSGAPRFFTADEFRMVDELTEIIIPADEHSPGARAAQVAAYLDGAIAEAFEDTPRQRWRSGLHVVDSRCREMHGVAFLAATPEQRLAVVTRMSGNEGHPGKPEERFFGELKHRTAHAYYTSKVGIHQEIEYKGNVLLNEFEGFDAGLVQIPSKAAAE
jgi:hypothetical protein